MDKKQVYYNFNVKSLCQKGCKLSKAAFLGKEYTVVPVSMIVSGAYFPGGGDEAGEPSALFFDGKDLEKSKDTWNGRPAALGHPVSGVTMNEPDTFNKQWLGFVFNTEYDKGKKRLAAELWLDDTRGDLILDKVGRGEEIDVSIGAYGTLVPEIGEANGVQYSYKYTDIRGDHLAVLPESEGACGWADGCGIRAESRKDETMSELEEKKVKGVEVKNKCEKAPVAEVEKVEESNVTCEDILKNPGKYDSAIVDAIKMRDEVRSRLVVDLQAVEFKGGPLCGKMLHAMSIPELSSIKSLVDHYKEAAENKVVAAEAKEVVAEKKESNVDYGLTASAPKDDSFKMEPVAIQW